MQSRPDPDMPALAQTLRSAAAMLCGEAAAQGAAVEWLRRLDYLGSPPAQVPHRAALLRAAAGFHRIFTLDAPDAPGLVVLGAEVDPACAGAPGLPLGSVAGTGLTFRQAFESCVGEGIEFLSQFATPDDHMEQLTAQVALADAPPALHALWQLLAPYRRDPATALTGWTTAADLADGRPVRLPADLCFRRPADVRDIDPPWMLGTGCGAGPDHLSATLHGLLELIERDAVALWWRGGHRPRLAPPGAGASVLAQLRRGAERRRTWLLDITSDLGVPVAVAASCNDDGFGLCCGHAAGLTLGQATDAAVREMAQMELAWRLSATKRQVRGAAALNDADRQHLRRYETLDVAATPALQPLAPPLPPHALPPHALPADDVPADDPRVALTALRQRLAAASLAPCVVNLTRPAFGIPVTRAICPGLEQGMSAPPGSRLSAIAKMHGIDPIAVAPL